MDWDYFDKFEDVIDKYMPMRGGRREQGFADCDCGK